MHKSFFFVLTRHCHLHLGKGACVVIYGPVIEQKWNKYGVELQVSRVICERNHENGDEENKMNPEYYVHLL